MKKKHQKQRGLLSFFVPRGMFLLSSLLYSPAYAMDVGVHQEKPINEILSVIDRDIKTFEDRANINIGNIDEFHESQIKTKSSLILATLSNQYIDRAGIFKDSLRDNSYVIKSIKLLVEAIRTQEQNSVYVMSLALRFFNISHNDLFKTMEYFDAKHISYHLLTIASQMGKLEASDLLERLKEEKVSYSEHTPPHVPMSSPRLNHSPSSPSSSGSDTLPGHMSDDEQPDHRTLNKGRDESDSSVLYEQSGHKGQREQRAKDPRTYSKSSVKSGPVRGEGFKENREKERTSPYS